MSTTVSWVGAEPVLRATEPVPKTYIHRSFQLRVSFQMKLQRRTNILPTAGTPKSC